MEWDAGDDPMVGVAVREVSGGNGIGVGTLTGVSADTLTWTAPGDASAGAAVELLPGTEAVVRGLNPGAWVRVYRFAPSGTAAPLSGAHAVTCIDRYNNLFPDVVTADAVSGLVTARAVMLLNDAGAATAFEAWVGEGDIEIDLEEPTSGELLGSGLSWSGATTEGAGPGLASVADLGEVGVHVRRTVAADSDPSGSTAWEVRYSYLVGSLEHQGAIRGRYRVEREDFIKEGLWIGLDGAPDLEAAPDETWTSRPHTTSLGLSLPITVEVCLRAMNKWGLWGAATDPLRYHLDAEGASGLLPPSGPTLASAGQTSGNLPTAAASYDAAADGEARASLWVLWAATDGTDPDGSGTPDAYQAMQWNAAIDDLVWTGSGSALDDGTPLRVLIRTRRLDAVAGATEIKPDVIQLDAENPGPLKMDAEIEDWPASGYAKVMNRFGRLLEVIHYSAIAVATGQTTVTVDERALMGTTARATSPLVIVLPFTATDSENTAAAAWEIVAVAPGRPRGALLYGTQGSQAQAPVTGPDGVTPVVLDAGENVHLLLGEGWASLYVDTTLVWRVLLNGVDGEMNGLYIPSEFDLVNSDVVGAASGPGIIDAVDGNTVYVCVRGQRRMLIDLSAMQIVFGELSAPGTLDRRAAQAGELERFGATMFLAWDTDQEDYRPYLELDSDGLLTSGLAVNQTLASAAVEALWN
jgi:hypothetical protein